MRTSYYPDEAETEVDRILLAFISVLCLKRMWMLTICRKNPVVVTVA